MVTSSLARVLGIAAYTSGANGAIAIENRASITASSGPGNGATGIGAYSFGATSPVANENTGNLVATGA